MAIKDGKPYEGKIKIDLSGPDGNAFMLIGYANRFGIQLGFSKEKIHAIIDDMRSSNYEHLIRVFDKHFGSVVDLYRG